MPIYEYECPKCGRFETVQKATDKPLKADPDCKCADCPRQAKRLISAAAFHLKGSGWYKTDYAGSNSTGTKGGAAESTPPSSSGDSGSGEKKKKKEDAPKKAASCGSGCGCH